MVDFIWPQLCCGNCKGWKNNNNNNKLECNLPPLKYSIIAM